MLNSTPPVIGSSSLPQPRAVSRRGFLKAVATALGFFELHRATAQTADPYAATLEASIQEASAKGIKFDYANLRQHPSSLVANVVLRLFIQNKIDLPVAYKTLHQTREAIKPYVNDPKGALISATQHLTQLLNQLSLKATKQTDTDINAVIKLSREENLDGAAKLLIEVLIKKGYL